MMLGSGIGDKSSNGDKGHSPPLSPVNEQEAAAAYPASASLLREYVGLGSNGKTQRRPGWRQWEFIRRLNFGIKDLVYMGLIGAVVTMFALAEDGYIGKICGGLIYSLCPPPPLPRFENHLQHSVAFVTDKQNLAPASEAIVMQKSMFHAALNESTRFRGDPRPELEEAWDGLLSGK